MSEQLDLIKEQLLVKALNSAYVSTDIINGHVKTLFNGDTRHQTLANVLVNHYIKTEEPITEATFKLRVAEKLDKDRTLSELPDEEKQTYYMEVKKLCELQPDDSTEFLVSLDKYVRKQLAEQAILEEASKLGSSGDIVSPLLERLDKINTLDITGQGSKAVSVYEDFEVKEEVYRNMNKEKLPMGLKPFDQALNGGLSKGEVGLLGARSGVGKTTFISNISVSYTKQGFNVFHISLEEKEGQSYLRFDKALLGVPNQFIYDGVGNVTSTFMEATRKVYEKKAQNLGKLYFYKGLPQTVTIERLRQLILATQRQRGIKFDVIMVDYPDLILNTKATGNESMDGGRVFERLRALAQELEVVMWTATQLNRGSANKDLLTLDDVEGSYRKKNVVEFAGTINVNKEERLQGYSRVYIDKLRNNNDYDEDMLYFKFEKTKGQLKDETEDERYLHLSLIQKEQTRDKQARKAQYAQAQNANPAMEGSIL